MPLASGSGHWQGRPGPGAGGWRKGIEYLRPVVSPRARNPRSPPVFVHRLLSQEIVRQPCGRCLRWLALVTALPSLDRRMHRESARRCRPSADLPHPPTPTPRNTSKMQPPQLSQLTKQDFRKDTQITRPASGHQLEANRLSAPPNPVSMQAPSTHDRSEHAGSMRFQLRAAQWVHADT